MFALIALVPETDSAEVDVTAPLNTALPVMVSAAELPLIAFAVTVEAVIVLAALSSKGPSNVTVAAPGIVTFDCKLMLPLCDAPPKLILVKFVPSKEISLLKMSSVDEPASLDPPTLMTLDVVVGLSTKVPITSTLADQLISLAVKLKLPILLKAAVMLIVPVPAFKVRSFVPPAIALAIEILPLLALESIETFVVIASDLPEPPKVMAPAPAVVLLVIIEPANEILLGVDGLNAPPE